MKDFTLTLRLPNEYSQGDIIEVKAKIKHPSTTGLGASEEANNPSERFFRAEPAEYIRLVEVYYGEEMVSKFEMNSSTANDPLLSFKLRADKALPVRVAVTDHRRETIEASADIQFS